MHPGVNIKRFLDLNRLFVHDHSLETQAIDVFFRNIKERLLCCISQADAIIGAVAWITDLDILTSLSEKPTLLVIQKEDFLRPDLVGRLSKEAKDKLLRSYQRFKSFNGKKIACGPFAEGKEEEYNSLDPILCFGNCWPPEAFRLPKMHNKFIVFLKEVDGLYYPSAVWTGSYNFTRQSMYSLENALLIKDMCIATSYACEAQMIYLMGEPLDWSREWINPNLRTFKSN